MYSKFALLASVLLCSCTTFGGRAFSRRVEAPYKESERKIQADLHQGFERSPLVDAKKILAPGMFQNDAFTIDRRVLHDGRMFRFHISSPYGEFYPRGKDELRLRVHELEVLKTLDEYSADQIVMGGVQRSAINILMGPWRVIERLGQAVWHPYETYEMFAKIPDGASALSESAFGELEEAKDAGTKAMEGDPQPAQSKLMKGAQEGWDYGLRHFGYNPESRAREWEERLDLDDSIKNDEITEKITRIAEIESAVNVAFKFVPGVLPLGVVGDVGNYLDKARRVARYTDKEARKEREDALLASIDPDPGTLKALNSQKHLSKMQRLVLMEYLGELHEVKDRKAFLSVVARGKDRASILASLKIVEFLTKYHRERGAISTLIDASSHTIAITKRARILLPMVVDFLTWHSDLGKEIAQVRSALHHKNAREPIYLHLIGQSSERCKRELKLRNVIVVQEPH